MLQTRRRHCVWQIVAVWVACRAPFDLSRALGTACLRPAPAKHPLPLRPAKLASKLWPTAYKTVPPDPRPDTARPAFTTPSARGQVQGRVPSWSRSESLPVSRGPNLDSTRISEDDTATPSCGSELSRDRPIRLRRVPLHENIKRDCSHNIVRAQEYSRPPAVQYDKIEDSEVGTILKRRQAPGQPRIRGGGSWTSTAAGITPVHLRRRVHQQTSS